MYTNEEREEGRDRFVFEEIEAAVNDVSAAVTKHVPDQTLADVVCDIVVAFTDRLSWRPDADQMQDFRQLSIALDRALFNHANRKLNAHQEMVAESMAEVV